VLVDDNQYVEKGTPLVKLDAKPFELAVAQKRAALELAKRNVDQEVAALEVARRELDQARSQARSQVAGLRGAWYLLQTVEDMVRYETAALQSNVANLNLQKANEHLAEQQFQNAKDIQGGAISKEEREQREANLEVARQQVNVAQQSAQQTRALLGLPANHENPATMPADVTRSFNGTRYALASVEQSLATLGVNVDLFSLHASDISNRITSMATDAMIDQTPIVRAAQARVEQAMASLGGASFDPAKPYDQPAVVRAQKDLEDAELQSSFTNLVAPISGYISRRSVNPGAQVQTGQNLMAIRPLADVWIEANFKETQLADLRIGQAVDIHVDAYPGKVFKGRVAGFSPGTGAVTSLLPPENATGNFVKVVQRLPVRIELTEKNPTDTPLFTGLSVEPEVDLKANPSGPDAGQRLRSVSGAPVANAAGPLAEGVRR
jgi:membrane fusion protein (multidrug efflux system)